MRATIRVGRWGLLVLLCSGIATAADPATTVAFSNQAWVLEGDTLRFEPYLGQNSLYLGRGLVTARGLDFRDGTIEFDMASGPKSGFFGFVFRVESSDAFETVFFRLGGSGTPEAVQYQPNLLGSGTWQIFHGPGANAAADLPRNEWIHVKVEIAGVVAKVYLRGAPKPVLTIPRLANGYRSGSMGFWTGPFGTGAYFANLKYSLDTASHLVPPAPDLAPGTIKDWQISEALEATEWQPSTLPELGKLTWQSVHAEPWRKYDDTALGLVLINRYRRGPNVPPPDDARVAMSGRAPGSKVVFARAFVDVDRNQFRRMHFGYSDGVVVFVNGQPLFFGMNPYPFRDLDGVMENVGEAVYLPLKAGRNEVVLAVMEFFGGWGFWTRMD